MPFLLKGLFRSLSNREYETLAAGLNVTEVKRAFFAWGGGVLSLQAQTGIKPFFSKSIGTS